MGVGNGRLQRNKFGQAENSRSEKQGKDCEGWRLQGKNVDKAQRHVHRSSGPQDHFQVIWLALDPGFFPLTSSSCVWPTVDVGSNRSRFIFWTPSLHKPAQAPASPSGGPITPPRCLISTVHKGCSPVKTGQKSDG